MPNETTFKDIAKLRMKETVTKIAADIVKVKNYQIQKLIGKGTISNVYQCTGLDCNGTKVDDYAIKITQKPMITDQKRLKNLNELYKNEMNVLKKIQGHPNIVKLYEIAKGT